mgnify:CR=1 FL=1
MRMLSGMYLCLVCRLQNRLLAKAFAAWRVWNARKRVAQRVRLAFQHRLLYQAWQTWVQTVEDIKLEGAALRHSQALLLRQEQQRAVVRNSGARGAFMLTAGDFRKADFLPLKDALRSWPGRVLSEQFTYLGLGNGNTGC